MNKIDLHSFVFSKSSINEFFRCPRSFYYRYVEKRKGTTSIAAKRGLQVHNLISRLNKREMCVKEVPSYYKNHIYNYIKFLEKYNFRLPKYIDEKLNLEYKGMKFTGIVDAVYLDKSEKKGVLVDYKSGKSSGSLQEYRFELQLYSLLLEKNYNLDIVRYGILFTKNGLFLYESNDKKYSEIDNVIEKLNNNKSMFDNNEYIAKANYMNCMICDFVKFCEFRAKEVIDGIKGENK